MRKLISASDFPNLDIALVAITGRTKKHFHRIATEFYYVISGSIRIEVDGTTKDLLPGSLLMIRPNTAHQAVRKSKGVAQVLVISSPPWQANDEIFVE
jgi:mannose-6-phosphate isomerase-like protein (cupin superfamily)